MGAVTQLKTSPKNLTSLFDFAILGPILGLCTSLVFLVTGMQSTLIATPEAVQYFPHLPVGVLQLSTLGGSIVDYFYGGNGMITRQSAASTVPLHPLAIAGFCGIIINSLELLPMGSSDGGRMSQALFGRSAHAVVGSATWVALLVCSFLFEQQDLLIGAWVVFNVAQSDMEVPCRNEVDKVNLPRSLAAFSLWFVAILAIAPMGISSG
jgi:membrane-associated protease RseP (regulator of RpoE activity)